MVPLSYRTGDMLEEDMGAISGALHDFGETIEDMLMSSIIFLG